MVSRNLDKTVRGVEAEVFNALNLVPPKFLPFYVFLESKTLERYTEVDQLLTKHKPL